MARRLGIKSPVPSELSLALGACEVTPLEVTSMYNTIAAGELRPTEPGAPLLRAQATGILTARRPTHAGGTYSSPHLVMRVADAQGNLLYHHKITRRKVPPDTLIGTAAARPNNCPVV